MKPHKHTLRMCVVCKAMKDKSELIRVVKNKEGAIFVDVSGKAAGRGAFVCGSSECINKCKKQKSFNRAFKCEIPETIYGELLAVSAETDSQNQ